MFVHLVCNDKLKGRFRQMTVTYILEENYLIFEGNRLTFELGCDGPPMVKPCLLPSLYTGSRAVKHVETFEIGDWQSLVYK
jgi:hypothetical protein